MKLMRLFILVCCITLLNGCASLGKGMMEAVLEQKTEDDRICKIIGQPFQGIFPLVKDPTSTTKVLMVHGVGTHEPGYSTQLLEGLAKKMKLNKISKIPRDIDLTKAFDATKELGKLKITRVSNGDNSQELLFYEMTWSAITHDLKQVLSYDSAEESSYRRATINNAFKEFLNDSAPDPMIYLGKSQEDILLAFSKAFCWMIAYEDWDDLPETSNQVCLPSKLAIESMRNNHYVIISHSLGSRIAIDGLQRIARLAGDKKSEIRKAWGLLEEFKQAFKEKHIPIFMLANQLPLLQLGRELPEVTGERDAYCHAEAEHYNSRLLSETNIIAFSDPNDILSYGIPPGFMLNNIDSRLCAYKTNITINVANIVDLMGVSYANPLEAHSGYKTDDRVLSLIVNGIGNENTSPIVKERCEIVTTD